MGNNVESALRAIREVMDVQSVSGMTPFDNSGERFKNDVFEVNAYDWSECDCGFGWVEEKESCTCGWEPQEWNFKWRDFEVSWYKYFGRGMHYSREISRKEASEMMVECIKSLL